MGNKLIGFVSNPWDLFIRFQGFSVQKGKLELVLFE